MGQERAWTWGWGGGRFLCLGVPGSKRGGSRKACAELSSTEPTKPEPANPRVLAPQYLPYSAAASYMATTFSGGTLAWSGFTWLKM